MYYLFQDPRFNSEVDIKMGYKTTSLLSMPIKDCDGKVIGVAQAVNKLGLKDGPFDEHDEKVREKYLSIHKYINTVKPVLLTKNKQ